MNVRLGRVAGNRSSSSRGIAGGAINVLEVLVLVFGRFGQVMRMAVAMPAESRCRITQD